MNYAWVSCPHCGDTGEPSLFRVVVSEYGFALLLCTHCDFLLSEMTRAEPPDAKPTA